MLKRISFSIPDDPNCGDVSKVISKMLRKKFPTELLGNILFGIEEELGEGENGGIEE